MFDVIVKKEGVIVLEGEHYFCTGIFMTFALLLLPVLRTVEGPPEGFFCIHIDGAYGAGPKALKWVCKRTPQVVLPRYEVREKARTQTQS